MHNCNCTRREEWEYESNNPADTKASEERGGGSAPRTRAEVPLQPVMKTMVRQAVPLQPMEVHCGADLHLQPMEHPTMEKMDAERRLWTWGKFMLEQAPARTCGPVERAAHTGAGFLAGLVSSQGTHTGAVCSWRTPPCGKNTRWSSSWRTAACGTDSHWRSSWRTVSRVRDPTLAQAKGVRTKEQQRRVMTERNPHSLSSCVAQGGRR